jgi:hypothetical protein
MSEKSTEQGKEDWLTEGFREYRKAVDAGQKEKLLRQAWAEGFRAGGEQEAKRRMEAKYRELNPPAEEEKNPPETGTSTS